MKERYDKHAYKELILIIEKKLISRVIMNPKATENDIQEHN